jgi:hypothetical protein
MHSHAELGNASNREPLTCMQLRMARQPFCLVTKESFNHKKGLFMKPRILLALFVLGLGLLTALAFGNSAFAERTEVNSATACACGSACECEDCACTCDDCDGRCTDCATCCAAATTSTSDESLDSRPNCCNVVRQCCVEKRSCCA